MPHSDTYRPVACSFYDELGLRMMRGRSCTLVVAKGRTSETIEAVIEDVFTQGEAEYVRLNNGRCIRLDRIQQVDDVSRPNAC
jgi:transcriptional antiterminator Rof (Rho-off)